MTPLSRALEQFDEKIGRLKVFGGFYFPLDPSKQGEEVDWEAVKSFISDFYHQILEEDIERLEKKISNDIGTAIQESEGAYNPTLAEEKEEEGWNNCVKSEITHKKQLLKELE